MKLVKIAETANTITLAWEPVDGVDGYRFYSAGKFRSDTWDTGRTTVKFSKGQAPYKVEAIQATAYDVIAVDSYPDGVEPPPPPPPPPPPIGYAPQAYNQGSRGQNAKFNIHENCTQVGPNDWRDGHGISYDDSGLCRGGRSEGFVPGLKPSDEMDGREPWDPYTGPDGQVHPPYPMGSYKQ